MKANRKTKGKKKQGISLIVLVITIIVMIILAAAVMISLTNAGIIGRANEATIASDIAHLKTQVEIIKGDAVLEKLQQGKNLTQQELITAIQERFNGSTVNGNIITVENGKYDIVVHENLNVAVVEHAKYTGPIKDIDVSYTTRQEESNCWADIRIDLLNVPSVREWNDETRNYFMENEFLNWLDTDGILELGGNIMYPGQGITSQMVYSQLLEPELGMTYDVFMPKKDKVIYDKYNYKTADMYLKDAIINTFNLDKELIQTYAIDILYAKDLLPHLSNKTADEIQTAMELWLNNQVTIDEITLEIEGFDTFEEYHASINSAFGITDESGYIFSRQQAMLILASKVYVVLTPLRWEYEEAAETESLDVWYKQNYITNSTLLVTEKNTIRITSPSGYVVELVIQFPDMVAPTVEIDITNITTNTITVETTATETEEFPSGIKEYRYYIKGPNDADYVLKAKTTETTYTYEGLTSDIEYEILVGVEDNTGNIGKTSVKKRIWITAMVDGVPIPKGFVASPYKGEKTKDGGLVIYELAENETTIPSSETEHTSKTTRNQYVWVPVEDFKSQFIRQNFDRSYPLSNKLGTQDEYWEVVLDTTTNMPLPSQSSTYMTITTPNGGITNTLAEVQAMYKSVKTYKGFYIARYEAGVDVGSQKREDDGEIIKSVHSKMNKAPYNYVRWTYNNKMNEDTNGAVEVARSIYPETNAKYGVVSTLTYGVQWDRTLAWWKETKATNGTGDVTIEDNDDLNNSILYGNYYYNEIPNATFNAGAYVSKDSGTTYKAIDSSYSKTNTQIHLLTTGATEEARVNNIYDMAGNLYEWTMEGDFADCRVIRGGGFDLGGDYCPVSYRGNYGPDYADNLEGFRPALYVKK